MLERLSKVTATLTTVTEENKGEFGVFSLIIDPDRLDVFHRFHSFNTFIIHLYEVIRISFIIVKVHDGNGM